MTDEATIIHVGGEPGYDVVAVLEPAERPSRVIPAAIALVLACGIAGLQYARGRKAAARAAGGG